MNVSPEAVIAPYSSSMDVSVSFFLLVELDLLMVEDNVGSLVSVTLVVSDELQSFDDNTCLLLERISELLSPFLEVVKVE